MNIEINKNYIDEKLPNPVYFVTKLDNKYVYGFKWYHNQKDKQGFRIRIDNFTKYFTLEEYPNMLTLVSSKPLRII